MITRSATGPGPFAAAPSSGFRCRTGAPTFGSDASLLVVASDIRTDNGGMCPSGQGRGRNIGMLAIAYAHLSGYQGFFFT